MKALKYVLTLLAFVAVNSIFAETGGSKGNGSGRVASSKTSGTSDLSQVQLSDPDNDPEGVKDWLYSFFKSKEDTSGSVKDTVILDTKRTEIPVFDRVVY